VPLATGIKGWIAYCVWPEVLILPAAKWRNPLPWLRSEVGFARRFCHCLRTAIDRLVPHGASMDLDWKSGCYRDGDVPKPDPAASGECQKNATQL
jgi:hypothetical protein